MVLEGTEGRAQKEVWNEQHSDLKLLSGLRAVPGAGGHGTEDTGQ